MAEAFGHKIQNDHFIAMELEEKLLWKYKQTIIKKMRRGKDHKP